MADKNKPNQQESDRRYYEYLKMRIGGCTSLPDNFIKLMDRMDKEELEEQDSRTSFQGNQFYLQT